MAVSVRLASDPVEQFGSPPPALLTKPRATLMITVRARTSVAPRMDQVQILLTLLAAVLESATKLGVAAAKRAISSASLRSLFDSLPGARGTTLSAPRLGYSEYARSNKIVRSCQLRN
jgi:hypothetical protein